jgi:glycerophosphoryl diester phosphodiesterase
MHRFIFLIISATSFFAAETVGPALSQAHAHNDYEHARPLLDALSHGFTSVEADIHLVDGQLLVGHDAKDLDPAKTLTSLYLDPLERLARGRKSIFNSGATLMLLVDIKTEGDPTYAALKTVLAKYGEMLTIFEAKSTRTNAVSVVLSGNRPRQVMQSEIKRYAGFDGRLTDLAKKNISPSFMPLVSDNWNLHFTWKGDGEFPESERAKLRSLVEQVHAENRRLRFWATPDKPSAWRELRAAGVDLINTDDLAGLAAFLRNARDQAK